MANMLDALKRIESKTTTARSDTGDTLVADHESIRPADDPGSRPNVDEVDQAADVDEVDEAVDVREEDEAVDVGEEDEAVDVGEMDEAVDVDELDQAIDVLEEVEAVDVREVDEAVDVREVDEAVDVREEGETANVCEADEAVDMWEADEAADVPVVQTIPFTAATEDHRARPAILLDAPLIEPADPAYLQLAKNIVGQFPKQREAAILFTSPGNGEGKTSTVVGLSAALASEEPGGVLAVDGNFQCPRLAGLVGIEANYGLGEVLSGQANWREMIQSARGDSLSVLPGSAGFSADVCTVNTANLADLLSELRREFRFVLFDAASLRYPEVAEMTRYFDGTYLVIELNRTSRGEARQAVRIIDNCEGRLLGCVLTNQVVDEGP